MLDVTPPLKLQRAKGRAHVGFVGGTRSKLADLHQSGCLKAILPRNHASRADVVFINTAGGITGGDHLRYSASIGDDAEACLTTQTAERLYRSPGDAGHIETYFEIGENAALDWLPQETIVFERSALKRRINISMANSASLLMCEPVVLGRKAMKEKVDSCQLSDIWKITRDGQLAYADALRITEPGTLTGPGALGENRAFATLLYVAPDAEARIDQMRSLLTFDNVHAAASAWNGCLVARFAALDGQPLRAALLSTLSQFRAHPMPRVWHM